MVNICSSRVYAQKVPPHQCCPCLRFYCTQVHPAIVSCMLKKGRLDAVRYRERSCPYRSCRSLKQSCSATRFVKAWEKSTSDGNLCSSAAGPPAKHGSKRRGCGQEARDHLPGQSWKLNRQGAEASRSITSHALCGGEEDETRHRLSSIPAYAGCGTDDLLVGK